MLFIKHKNDEQLNVLEWKEGEIYRVMTDLEQSQRVLLQVKEDFEEKK